MEVANLKFYNQEGKEVEVSEPWRKELADMLARRGLPGDIQREVYKSMLPIFRKYREMRKCHMSKFRILGLASEALKEAWLSAR